MLSGERNYCWRRGELRIKCIAQDPSFWPASATALPGVFFDLEEGLSAVTPAPRPTSRRAPVRGAPGALPPAMGFLAASGANFRATGKAAPPVEPGPRSAALWNCQRCSCHIGPSYALVPCISHLPIFGTKKAEMIFVPQKLVRKFRSYFSYRSDFPLPLEVSAFERACGMGFPLRALCELSHAARTVRRGRRLSTAIASLSGSMSRRPLGAPGRPWRQRRPSASPAHAPRQGETAVPPPNFCFRG